MVSGPMLNIVLLIIENCFKYILIDFWFVNTHMLYIENTLTNETNICTSYKYSQHQPILTVVYDTIAPQRQSNMNVSLFLCSFIKQLAFALYRIS